MSFTLGNSSDLLEQQLSLWDESIDPGIVTIGGTDYAAAVMPGRAQGMEAPNGGGWLTVQDLRIDIRKTLLAAPPATQTGISWNGHVFEFQNYDGDAPGALTWVLRCRRII